MASPKPKFEPEQVAKALNECQGMVFFAARKLGCSHDTIERYVKRHAVCREARDKKRGEFVDTAESGLLAAVLRGEGWAIRFTLRHLGKDRGYVERKELTGADGGPLKTETRALDWNSLAGRSARPDPVADRLAEAERQAASHKSNGESHPTNGEAGGEP